MGESKTRDHLVEETKGWVALGATGCHSLREGMCCEERSSCDSQRAPSAKKVCDSQTHTDATVHNTHGHPLFPPLPSVPSPPPFCFSPSLLFPLSSVLPLLCQCRQYRIWPCLTCPPHSSPRAFGNQLKKEGSFIFFQIILAALAVLVQNPWNVSSSYLLILNKRVKPLSPTLFFFWKGHRG